MAAAGPPGQRITIPVTAGLFLEGCLDLPEGEGPFPGVVLCHPHPLYGGDMENNVILAASRALTKRGIAALRFNFRGVGKSQGTYSGGPGEQEDARAALAWLTGRKETDPARTGIMGYSFGGMIALLAGEASPAARALAAVSPVLTAGMLTACEKPKMIICGGADSLLPAPQTIREAEAMAGPKTVLVIPGVDHFWRGRENEAAVPAAEFFKEIFAR